MLEEIHRLLQYGNVCNHDDDYLCPKRLVAISKYLSELGYIPGNKLFPLEEALIHDNPHKISGESFEDDRDWKDYEPWGAGECI